MMGTMTDQVASNGNMSTLQLKPDIALQFPIACKIRQRIFSNTMVLRQGIKPGAHVHVTKEPEHIV